tara:strand:+ start:2616 stop:3863 length:1248 start_codon:yes stop_codon:yes gene_type:complete
MFFIYNILISILILISPIIILIRIIKKKEDKIRFKEKFCFFSKKRGKGKLIWLHGSSVGEILSIVPLIEKLENKITIDQILITSSTLSSSKVLSKYKFKKTIHQFFPIDSSLFAKKFLDYWKPSLSIFIESEIWPNMLISIKKRSIPLLLLNARITKKSYERWKLFPSTSKTLFKSFDICFSQNKETKKYLQYLGAKKIKLLGNLKFSESKFKEKYSLSNKYKALFKLRKIWCAASTHNSEEKICALAHKKLKNKYKNLLTIIIPRHIHRTNAIIDRIKSMNLNIQSRSSNLKIKHDTDIFIVDSYGETKSFYKICKLVFLGGSLINHGGQNPLEAARFGSKILHGPYIQNFTEVYKLLENNNISFKFNNVEQLIELINKSFVSKKSLNNKVIKLKKIGSDILDNTFEEINNYLK